MRKLFTIFLFLISYEAFSQTVVVKNPAWEIEDATREKAEMTDRLREYAKLSEQVATERENL